MSPVIPATSVRTLSRASVTLHGADTEHAVPVPPGDAYNSVTAAARTGLTTVAATTTPATTIRPPRKATSTTTLCSDVSTGSH
jgi:hypothetical protein